MKVVTIGYTRDDGDFAVLATLNNNDGHLSEDAFMSLVNTIASEMCREMLCQVDVLERQDAPDYITLGE